MHGFAHLEMLHGMHTHRIQYRRRLPAEHLHDAHMLLGVEIPHKHPLAQHLVQQRILWRPGNAVFAHGRLLVRQATQRGVSRGEQRRRLTLGRQTREKGQGREDGVLDDLR
jgi:hypothetical protein